MTKRPPTPKANWEEIFSHLIPLWRRLHKLPSGPIDHLQTREFRSLVEAVSSYPESKDFSDKNQLGAHLLYEWPLHLAQGLSLLQELPIKPQRVLDIGSGAAPFAISALMYGATEAFAMDISAPALKYAGELAGLLGHPLSVREHDCKDLRKMPTQGRFDLIIVAYALDEMFSTLEAKLRYVRSLYGMLSETGYLLLVDSSENTKNKKMLELRDALVKEHVRIQAPCIWKGLCPALDKGAPCYAQRPFEKPFMISEIQRSAKINLSSLKMSYLLFKHPSLPMLDTEERLYRIISPPIETFRGPRYFLCGVDGRKMLGSQLKEHPKQSRAYEYLKRGDAIAIQNPVEVGDDLQVAEDTTLVLKAPCDKPLI